MRIGVDIDGVIRDLIGRFIDIYWKLRPEMKNHVKYPDDFVDYWFHDLFPEGKDVYRLLFEEWVEDVYVLASPIGNPKESIELIRGNGHSVYLISSQPNSETRKHTVNWLIRNSIDFDGLIFESDKYTVGIDILVDDSPENLIRAKSRGIVTVKIDYPYNRWVVSNMSYSSFDEFAGDIRRIRI